jgi:hypothetical protein
MIFNVFLVYFLVIFYLYFCFKCSCLSMWKIKISCFRLINPSDVPLNLLSRHEMETFQHLTYKCDLEFGRSNPLCTSSHYGDHLCQVIFKKFQLFKIYEANTKCRLFIMKWKLLNIWPLSVNLAFGMATQFLHSAHHLIMVITFAKLFQKVFSCYGADTKVLRTDRQTDILMRQ